MAHTEQSVREVINKIAKQNQYNNYEIELNEIFTGGANYTSKLYTVVIKEVNKDDLHLFAKAATIGEKVRNDMPLAIFDKERVAYTTLAEIYKSLEEENHIPENHRLLFTKCYGYDPTLYKEILVLENLLAQGYSPYNRFEVVKWDYATSAVSELAKLHALSFAFNKKYPEEFARAVKAFKMEWKEGVMDDLTQSLFNTAVKNVKPQYRDALEKFAEKYVKDLLITCYTPVRTTAIIHGDFRGSNLLHRKREDGTVEIKIVDLQTLQGGSPVTDLLYFIFTGSDEHFREQYYDKLIDHYYTQLSEAMKRLHLNPDEIFSREDFDNELKEKLPFGLTLAMFTLPVITVDAENAPEVNETLEIANFSVEKTSDLYTERLNGVVNDYVRWGILK